MLPSVRQPSGARARVGIAGVDDHGADGHAAARCSRHLHGCGAKAVLVNTPATRCPFVSKTTVKSLRPVCGYPPRRRRCAPGTGCRSINGLRSNSRAWLLLSSNCIHRPIRAYGAAARVAQASQSVTVFVFLPLPQGQGSRPTGPRYLLRCACICRPATVSPRLFRSGRCRSRWQCAQRALPSHAPASSALFAGLHAHRHQHAVTSFLTTSSIWPNSSNASRLYSCLGCFCA